MVGLSRGTAVALALVAVVSYGCSSGRTPASATQSPPQSAAPGLLGTRGTVMFASEKVGWVISPHAARHETDVYRTADGGLSWSLWASLPEVVGGPSTPGISVVVGESALLLVPVDSDRHSDHIMFRAEGGKWERRNFPGVPPGVFVTVAFLPDMKHGWLLRDNYGDFFQTVDGGRTWKMLTSFQRFEAAGPSTPIFWSATDGSMYYNSGGGSFGLLMTRDSGAT